MLSGQQTLGLTRDLSERGLFVTCARPGMDAARRLLGESLQLEFALPGSRELIWAQGEVRYVEHDGLSRGVGVLLTNMAERHARMLRGYTEQIHRARLQNELLRAPRGLA